ncbi:Glu-tRNA(Gln) amidotransferase subunit GatD [Candidatus Woesearchaeota archaeon]|nr:Glu-tRNA(Gln) amidotransferase subunit GatD [Candidatus Woesearchaeota archaeon]
MEAKAGDAVEIKLKDESINGILMPEETDFSFIKLDNGYNLGIKKRNIKSINIISKKKTKEGKFSKVKKNKKLPDITILHTGGTIASKVDYKTGGVLAQFKPEELVGMFPELGDIVNIKSRLIGNIMSENMVFEHYNLIAKEIKKEVEKGVKGIIVTHGTDTMHYTSAALSFILEDLSVPVVLVGAQRSSDRGSSDAAVNLISACIFVANTAIAGVTICMHENQEDDKCLIIDGLNSRKMHTSRRDAFRPINKNPIAKVNYKNKKVELINIPKIKNQKPKLKLRLFKDVKVGLIKSKPGMYAEEFNSYKNFDGLIIEGTGLGHIPVLESDKFTKENKKILNTIKELCKKTVTVMTSQTIYGRVNLNVYSSGRLLSEAGVLGNYCDTTPETSYIKLAWLLSNYPKKEVQKLYSKNLRGEVSERSENIFLI